MEDSICKLKVPKDYIYVWFSILPALTGVFTSFDIHSNNRTIKTHMLLLNQESNAVILRRSCSHIFGHYEGCLNPSWRARILSFTGTTGGYLASYLMGCIFILYKDS